MNENKMNMALLFQADLVLESPLTLGNGQTEYSHKDLMLDKSGRPLIPGSSMAGMFYHYFSSHLEGEELAMLNQLWGSDNGDGDYTSSMIYFYDALYSGEWGRKQIGKRDGVRIDDSTKTARKMGKYDFQILYPGNRFQFKVEILLREKHKSLRGFAEKILRAIWELGRTGKVRLGGKTSRGYGLASLEKGAYHSFDFAGHPETFEDYVNHPWSFENHIQVLEAAPSEIGERVWNLLVPLALNRSLLIRSYDVATWDVDARQLDNPEHRAVIPGTSWAGVFRSHVQKIYKEIVSQCTGQLTEKQQGMIQNETAYLFGIEKRGATGQKSRIIFDESADAEESHYTDITRVAIDRFTGGGRRGALATNRVTVDGHFNLSVTIDGPSDVEKALIYLAITDLCDGMIAVGGETAIGRGVFSLDSEKAEDYLKVVVDESQGWCDALLKHIKEGLGGK